LEYIIRLIAHHQDNFITSLFYFYVIADSRNSNISATYIWSYGISLPFHDYYLEDNEKFNKIRAEYLIHFSNMFQLIGVDAATAETNTQIVMEIETRLAQAQRPPVQDRNRQCCCNKKYLKS